MASFKDIDPSLSPSSRIKRASDDEKFNFIKNIFPTIFHYIQNTLPFASVVHVVPDVYIQVYKLRFDYDGIIEKISTGATVTDVAAIIKAIDIFQITDVRDVTTVMSSGKTPGSANFTINQLLLNESLVETVDLAGFKYVTPEEALKNVGNTDVIIDFMDIVKVFERNRFDDDYTCTFTGFITSITHRDQPKMDYSYQYGAHDISTAMRLAPVLSQINLQQLMVTGDGAIPLQDNLIWDSPLVANKPAIELIKDLINNSWWTYPNTAQIETSTQPSDNKKFTRLQILNPSAIGLLQLNVFPANLTDIKAYGAVFKSNLNLSFYQQSDKLPYDVCKDIADTIGLEFYATPEGNLYFGIPKWDIDVDGSYYSIDSNGIISRSGYYDLNGDLVDDPIQSQDYIAESDLYTINEEDFLGYEETSTLENVSTRVDVSILDWSQDILSAKNATVIPSAFRESFFFSYPDLQFWNLEKVQANSEILREMTKYGIRPFPVKGKVFLKSDEAIKAYAQFVYDKLKGMRKQAKLTILPRPEIRAGRTIRIPHKNLIAYVMNVTNSVMPKKSASTTLSLAFIRNADLDPENSRFGRTYDSSEVEAAYGSFVPAGTFDFTSLPG